MEGGGGGSMSFENQTTTRGPSALRVDLQKMAKNYNKTKNLKNLPIARLGAWKVELL